MEAQVFEEKLREKTAAVEQMLGRYLPGEEGPQGQVVRAMNYSLLAGGKRLRPLLMQEAYLMCGGDAVVGEEPFSRAIEHFMAAIEMIHTYSLVHDDLPAMDNDKERRGKATTWYQYGEAMGILAGDGLLNYAFETAAGAFACCSRESDTRRLAELERVGEALAVLARKTGIHGMIGGQAVDVEPSGKQGQEGMEELLFIHEHKTAALIQAALMVGAILGGASREQTGMLEKCGYNVGLAFQIQDDILDVVGDSGELGKPTGSDAQNHKQTYVTVKGLEQSREDVAALSREAAAILDGFPGEHPFLKQLIISLTERRK